MKKRYGYFFIILFLGIISCNAFVNLLEYNIRIRSLFEDFEMFRYILLIGATGITSFLTSKGYKKAIGNVNKENEIHSIEENKQKEKANLSKYNFEYTYFTQLIFIRKWYLNEFMFCNGKDNKRYRI